MTQDAKKPYFVYENLPCKFMGADMYPILEGKSVEEVLATKKIECFHGDKDIDFIGFAPVCQQAYKVTRHPIAQYHCGSADIPHGHFIIWGSDGTAIIPLMVQSYSFFNFVVDNLPKIIYEVRDQHVPVVKKLLDEKGRQLSALLPTEKEQEFINNPELLKKVSDSIYYMSV